VYRRFNQIARMGWLDEADIRLYFRSFLREFVPSLSGDEWGRWEDRFMGMQLETEGSSSRSPWISRPISLDMLKQFLMQQVSEAAVAGFGIASPKKKTPGSDDSCFQVKASAQEEFRDLMCNQEAAEAFLTRYAPVWRTDLEAAAQ